jgi:multicomponent Na+:H+ antiporter subunit D
LILGLIIAVVDIAAFGELYVLAQTSAVSFSPHGTWLAFAVLTALIASLLMLSARTLKRLLVLSTVEDVGFLLFGIVSLSSWGLAGALLAAATHALAKALLFVSLIAPEADGALETGRGLAVRYPVSAFGFLFGLLAMVGVPPLIGFIGRWKLYTAALQISPLLMAAFLLASAFALIGYIRALTRMWWGPALPAETTSVGNSAGAAHSEPLCLKAVIVGFVLLVLAGGLAPQAIESLLNGGRL